jgi:hypothetical protein
MPFVEDLSTFFADADEATLDGQNVRGIFDGAYHLREAGDDVGVTVPAFTLASADVPAEPTGLALVVVQSQSAPAITAYTVVEPRPDGTGITVLRLREE